MDSNRDTTPLATTDIDPSTRSSAKSEQSEIIFPIFITQNKFTSVSSRYYFPEFISNLAPNSIIIDVQSELKKYVYEILNPMQTMELQSLDFGGTVGLKLIDKNPTIILGCNELVYQKEDDSLLVHQMNFVQFINKGNYASAWSELKYIGLWAEKNRDNNAIFNYLLAQGHIHEIRDKYEVAKKFYSQAYEYLTESMENTKSITGIAVGKLDLCITDTFNWNDIVEGLIFHKKQVGKFDIFKELRIRAGIPEPSISPRKNIAELLGIKPVTKIPGRFSVRSFTHNIFPETIVINAETGEHTRLSDLLQPMDTIDIQTLDFAGILFLKLGSNSQLEVKFAINELSEGIEEDSLQAHQMIFCNAVDQYNFQIAMSELKRIRIMTRNKVSKYEEFYYMMAHARVLMRMRERNKRIESLEGFKLAIDYLHTNFSEEEIAQLSIEKAQMYRYTDKFNWDSFLFAYDEVVALVLCTGVASLLNLATSENEYNELNAVALEKAKLYDMPLYTHFIKYNIGEIYVLEGKIDEGIRQFEDSLTHMQNMENYPSEYYADTAPWLSAELLVDLYLRKNNVAKALETVTKIKSEFPFSEKIVAKICYFRAMMHVKTHEGDINGSIDYGIELYDYITQISGEQTGYSSIYYIQPIYTMLIQAIYSGRSDILSRYNEIAANIFLTNADINDSGILMKLIELYQSHINMVEREFEHENFDGILMEYNLILSEKNISLNAMRKSIIQYLNFAISYIDLVPELKSQIIDWTADFTDNLMDSANTLLTVKTHLINMVLSERMDELKNWLSTVDKFYDLSPLKEIIIKVDLLDNTKDIAIIKKFLLELIELDLIWENYAFYETMPLSMVIFS